MPQEGQATVQSVMSDPKFLTLTKADQIAVLGKVDSNFASLPSDTQLEVISHMSQRLNLPPVVGPGGLQPNPGETEAQFMQRYQASSPQQQEATRAGAFGRAQGAKEDVRTALPYVGAGIASLAAGPEAGIATRMLMAGLGGAGGSAVSHAIPGGNQPPLLSTAGALDVAGDAAKQATFELGGALLGKGVGALVGRMTTKVPVEEAAAKIANSIAPDLTPSEFGNTLRQTLATTRQTLGAQKSQILEDIINNFRLGNRNPLAESAANAGGMKSLFLDNTTQAVNRAIRTLEGEKRLTPSLFATGEAKSRTLSVLYDIKNSLTSISPGMQTVTSPILDEFGRNINTEIPLPIPAHYSTIKDLDILRSNLFQMGQGINRPLPKSIIGQLTHAVHEDIGATFAQFGPSGEDAFRRYENASSTFRDVASTLETSTFKRIMNANVNQPEKVFNILMQAPETNVENLTTILKNAKNGPAVIDSVKHLALERAAANPQLLNSIPEPAREVIFGSDLPKIQKFFDSVEEAKTGMSMLSKVFTHATGVVGGGATGAAIGHPMLGIGAGEMAANYIIRSGAETRTISSTQLAILLGNPTTRQLLMRAAQTPASGQASALIMRALGTYAEMPTAPPAQPTPQTPVPAAGATIGDQLRAKGIALPTPAPSTPGLPFHPGAGLGHP